MLRDIVAKSTKNICQKNPVRRMGKWENFVYLIELESILINKYYEK
jgi:hypothetical protein